MIIEHDDSLANWIKKRVGEICDAEPVAFAKYVLALLKKDSSEDKLRGICEEQLNVFLGSNTKEFVDSLFDTLNNRSYLSSVDDSTSQETGASSSVESQKESQNSISSVEVHHKSDNRTQRRRISPPRDSKEDSRSKYSPRRRRSRSRSRSRSPYQRRRGYNGRDRNRSRSRSPHRRDHRRSDRNVVSSTGSTTRVRCRDFEELGICRRGNDCKFDHGPDLIVLDDNSAAEFTTNPPPGVDIKRSTNGSGMPEAYNPEAPGMNAPVTSGLPNFMPNFSVPPPPLPTGMGSINQYVPQNMQPMPQGFRSFGRGRGRGRFNHFSERVQPNKSTTIEVRRIPPEVNKLGIIHKHFEQYGDITNIQISFDSSPDTALVTYAKLPDAQKAMKDPKPIMDNRFIQLSWHKPPLPKPETSPESMEIKTPQDSSLANVKPVIPLLTEPKASSDPPSNAQVAQAQAARQLAEVKLQARRKERQMRSHLQKIHVLKTSLYEKQATELKNLFEHITKATDPKLKVQLATMAKKLDESLKDLSKEIHELYEQIQKTEKPANDGDSKSPKKRRLNSSENENTEADPAKKKQSSEAELSDKPDSTEAEPSLSTIKKLLATSDDEEDDQPNKSRVELDEDEENDDKTDEKLLEESA